jgi:hypothetical protein
MPGQRFVNVLVRGLLRTPILCRIVGSRLVTLYVAGRNSGRVYPLPVAYLRHGSDLLIGTSSGWARNPHTGESLAIRLQGKLQPAAVQVPTTEPEVVFAYARMARVVNPTFAKFITIRIGPDGEPELHDLHLAWPAVHARSG